MKTGYRFLLCLVLMSSGLLLRGDQPKADEHAKPKGPSAEEALQRLRDGNKRFVERKE